MSRSKEATWDGRAGYIYVSKGKIAKTKIIKDATIICDYDKKGKIIGVEVLLI